MKSLSNNQPTTLEGQIAMDSLQDELAKLRRDASLSQSIQDVDKIIQQLEKARGTIEAGESAIFAGVPVELLFMPHELTLHRSQVSFYNPHQTTKPAQDWL